LTKSKALTGLLRPGAYVAPIACDVPCNRDWCASAPFPPIGGRSRHESRRLQTPSIDTG